MKTACSALILLFAFLVVPAARSAEIAPAKRAEIEKLIAVAGLMKQAQTFSAAAVDALVKALRAANPKISEKTADIVTQEVNAVIAEHIGELKGRMMAVYDKYYTLEDLEAINAFYASPVGRKVIATMPTVTRESMALGQDWGRSLGPEIEQRIKTRCAKECVAAE